jgi:hypothetical protein
MPPPCTGVTIESEALATPGTRATSSRVSARGGACQLQIREVRARDEQDERDDRKDRNQRVRAK